MDLIDRIVDVVNSSNPPLSIRKGVLAADKESLVIYPLPGSAMTEAFMDDSNDANINLEISMMSKDGDLLEDCLWQIQNSLENINDLQSSNNSFEFNSLEITSKPFISKYGDQGWLVFQLTFYVSVHTKEDKKNWLDR